jgi:penicillin-binding protein 1A
VRDAIKKSVNTIAWQIFKDVTPEVGLEYLDKLRVSSLSWMDNGNLALSLGGYTYGLKPVEIARGFHVIENGGVLEDKDCILMIEHEKDGVVYNNNVNKTEDVQVYTNDTAYIIADCLKGVVNDSGGTGSSARVKGQIVAGKTGTTNDRKDGWFVGFTTHYTASVWMGYDTPRTIKNLTGGGLPAQIFSEFMTAIHDGLEEEEFKRPVTVVERNVNYSGRPVEYKSSRIGLFSEQVEKKEEDRILGLQYMEYKRLVDVFAEGSSAWDLMYQAHSNLCDFENLLTGTAITYSKVHSAYLATMNAIRKIEDAAVRADYTKRLEDSYVKLKARTQNYAVEVKSTDDEEEKADADGSENGENSGGDGKNSTEDEYLIMEMPVGL